MNLPEEVQAALNEQTQMRDWVRQELQFRQLSGRRHHPDLKEMSDEECEEQIAFNVNKINELLAPYEKD